MQPNTDREAPQALSLKEIAAMLVKHFGHHEGLFEVSFGVNVGIGPVGQTPEQVYPGVMVAISNVGLTRASKMGPNTVDAAEVNPAVKPSTPTSKRSRRIKTA